MWEIGWGEKTTKGLEQSGGKRARFLRARFDAGVSGSESAEILSFADVCLGCPPTPPEFSLASTVSAFGVSFGIWPSEDKRLLIVFGDFFGVGSNPRRTRANDRLRCLGEKFRKR